MNYDCDIILLSYENPDLLKKCVQSVLDHTKVRSRLIIVDNASKEAAVGTYLHGIHGNSTVTIEKVFSEENAGFAGGMNKGLKLSIAPFVCLLNNDCEVTEGWLEEMIRVANADKTIGIVNPQSSTFGSFPDKGATINDHARLIKHRAGKYMELGHAIGFAFLIKREVIERIGYLDEAYEGVCYEDTDFSARAREAGFIPVVAEGAYVFHAEQASRRKLPGKEKIYSRNRELFEKRWGKILRMLVLDTPSRGKSKKLSDDYESLKGIARERVFIDLWISKRHLREGISSGFDRRKMIRHADISIRSVPGKLMALMAIWKVLTKKKKYDAIILKEGPLSWIIKILKPFHRAIVFSMGAGTGMVLSKGRSFDLKDPAPVASYIRKGE